MRQCSYLSSTLGRRRGRSNQISLVVADDRRGSNSAFLLGGRTSASAECRHWSERAVRWSSCAILLSSNSSTVPSLQQGHAPRVGIRKHGENVLLAPKHKQLACINKTWMGRSGSNDPAGDFDCLAT
jgi:hypothetical protein